MKFRTCIYWKARIGNCPIIGVSCWSENILVVSPDLSNLSTAFCCHIEKPTETSDGVNKTLLMITCFYIFFISNFHQTFIMEVPFFAVPIKNCNGSCKKMLHHLHKVTNCVEKTVQPVVWLLVNSFCIYK